MTPLRKRPRFPVKRFTHPFILSHLCLQIYKAVKTAAEHSGSDAELWRKIKADEYMRCAVEECYASLKFLFDDLIVGSQEKWWVLIPYSGIIVF